MPVATIQWIINDINRAVRTHLKLCNVSLGIANGVWRVIENFKIDSDERASGAIDPYAEAKKNVHRKPKKRTQQSVRRTRKNRRITRKK